MIPYNKLSDLQILKLEKQGVLNGCWAAKGLKLDPYIKKIEKKVGLPVNFSETIKREVCHPHDYRYTNGSTIIDKVVADLRFGTELSKVLKSFNIPFLLRLAVVIPSVATLIAFWGKAVRSNK